MSETLSSDRQLNPDVFLPITEDHCPSDGDWEHLKPCLKNASGEEDYEELPLLEDSLKTVQSGKKLEAIKNENHIECLRRNQDVFAWSFLDMLGISPEIAC